MLPSSPPKNVPILKSQCRYSVLPIEAARSEHFVFIFFSSPSGFFLRPVRPDRSVPGESVRMVRQHDSHAGYVEQPGLCPDGLAVWKTFGDERFVKVTLKHWLFTVFLLDFLLVFFFFFFFFFLLVLDLTLK